MGRKCLECGKAENCHSNLSFYRFPSNTERRNIWFSILNIVDPIALPQSLFLCSEHFDPNDIVILRNGKKKLKTDANPLLPADQLFEVVSSNSSSPVNGVSPVDERLPIHGQIVACNSLPVVSKSPETTKLRKGNMLQPQGSIPCTACNPYVNNQLINPIPTNKPGVEPKRPPKPVNITQLVKLSPTVPNHITVNWAAECGKDYAMTVAVVDKLTSLDLLRRLKQKGAKNYDYTRGLIKKKLNDDDNDIATTSLKVSLICPLGKKRMTTSCRPITCSHFQCFDAELFLQMNERKSTWICPVCHKPAIYDSLVIDGYFQDVLTSKNLLPEVNEIELHKDGSWSIKNTENKLPKIDETPDADLCIEIINDDVEFALSNVTTVDCAKESNKEPKNDDVYLTLSDSDDDEPLTKRRIPNPKSNSTIKCSDKARISHNSNQSRMTTTQGPSFSSSLGYAASPEIISLDSPSPPMSPQATPQNQQAHSFNMHSTNDT